LKCKVNRGRWIVLSLFLLVVSFSMTVFAEGETNVEEKIDLNESGNYKIEFEEPECVYTYTGLEIEPAVRVFLVDEEEENEDLSAETNADDKKKCEVLSECYYVEYQNNINAGTATVSVTGIEEKGYTGTISEEFEISAKSLENAKISMSSNELSYDGNAKEPEVTVILDDIQLQKGIDYDVSYYDNLEVGDACVKIEGKGNYKDTLSKEFKIVVAKATISTKAYYNKIKISWKKVEGASGYAVYRSTSEKGKYTRIATVKPDKLSYENTKLTTGKTYYYKVRAFRTVNGKNVYGTYSGIKKQRVQPVKATLEKLTRESTTSLKISWKKVSGASGYAVYRSKTEKGGYERIKTIKGSSNISYTDKGLTCGRTY